MLKKNFLASTSVYVSLSHNKRILQKYYKNLEMVFKQISDNSLKKISSKIKGEIVHTEINRLN